MQLLKVTETLKRQDNQSYFILDLLNWAANVILNKSTAIREGERDSNSWERAASRLRLAPYNSAIAADLFLFGRFREDVTMGGGVKNFSLLSSL